MTLAAIPLPMALTMSAGFGVAMAASADATDDPCRPCDISTSHHLRRHLELFGTTDDTDHLSRECRR